MSEKPNNGMLGYTQEEYKKFSKNAWIVLLAFSVLYCFLYCGRLGEIFGVNRFIVAGMFLSAAANLLIGFQSSLIVIAVLWGFNGYFQSMLWSPGNRAAFQMVAGRKARICHRIRQCLFRFRSGIRGADRIAGVYHYAKQRLESGIYRTGCHYGYFRHYLYFPGKRQPEKDWSERIRGPGRETP